MPKIRRANVPPRLLRHLLDRIREREIAASEVEALARWLDTDPEVPKGEWYKRFPGMTVCGEGELVKTFLKPKQTPVGVEAM